KEISSKLQINLEIAKNNLDNIKEVTSQAKEVTEKVSHSLSPMINSLAELSETSKLVLDQINQQIKKVYVEGSSLIYGAKELIQQLKKMIPFPKFKK
ncbi:MAG TPA: hypothetical protein DEA54_01665, partial [Thermodesulfobacterium commune]|nr:hypothetical protein [Thermodesulfobacterium commune]